MRLSVHETLSLGPCLRRRPGSVRRPPGRTAAGSRYRPKLACTWSGPAPRPRRPGCCCAAAISRIFSATRSWPLASTIGRAVLLAHIFQRDREVGRVGDDQRRARHRRHHPPPRPVARQRAQPRLDDRVAFRLLQLVLDLLLGHAQVLPPVEARPDEVDAGDQRPSRRRWRSSMSMAMPRMTSAKSAVWVDHAGQELAQAVRQREA